MNIILRSAVRILRFSGGTNEMHRILLIIMLALAVGCAGAPESDDTSSAETESGCPSWMVAVEEDGRILCVERDILEREREIIEAEERW
jgi:hypothetical protein